MGAPMTHPMNYRSFALLLSLSTMVTSCKPTMDDARAEFVQAHTCPADRVEVTERKDLKGYDVIFGKSSPPADIAHDPERRLMWQKNQDESEARWNGRTYVFELRGCKHHVLSACKRMKSSVSCSERDVPADQTK